MKIMNDCDVFVNLKSLYFNLIWSKIFVTFWTFLDKKETSYDATS